MRDANEQADHEHGKKNWQGPFECEPGTKATQTKRDKFCSASFICVQTSKNKDNSSTFKKTNSTQPRKECTSGWHPRHHGHSGSQLNRKEQWRNSIMHCNIPSPSNNTKQQKTEVKTEDSRNAQGQKRTHPAPHHHVLVHSAILATTLLVALERMVAWCGDKEK